MDICLREGGALNVETEGLPRFVVCSGVCVDVFGREAHSATYESLFIGVRLAVMQEGRRERERGNTRKGKY